MKKYSVPAIERMNSILNFLENESEGRYIGDIVEVTGIAKTTCLRLLSSMTQLGYLSNNTKSSSYKLGTRFVQLGQMAAKAVPWVDDLRTMLADFADDITETVKVSILENSHIRVLLRVDSPSLVKISFTPGSIFPLHAGGASKLLLAGLTLRERQELLPETLKCFTRNTITDKGVLARHLEDVVEQGFAVDAEEYMDGLIAVAVPLKLPESSAALSVSFMRPAVPEEKIQELLPRMWEFSRGAEERLVSGNS